MGPLLVELNQLGVPMFALSNYPVWYRLIEAELQLSRFVDWAFVSCETGVRKPDPRAYLQPCAQLGVMPEEALFVDDRVGNCSAAAAVGLRTVVFQGADHLRAELRAQGIPLLRAAAD
jgi:FMN phosphatase YigB (HAD superfamily)